LSVLTLTQRQQTTAVCRGGGLNKYQPAAADAFQRPLRSRFQARLSRSDIFTDSLFKLKAL
jgi:hypothetical protein